MENKKINKIESRLSALIGKHEYDKQLTRRQKKHFLELLIVCIPSLIERTKEKMKKKNKKELYFERPKKGYNPHLVLTEGILKFDHSIYSANLEEDDIIEGVVHFYDWINTYPDKENLHHTGFEGGDSLEEDFRDGSQMYKSIKLFLRKD